MLATNTRRSPPWTSLEGPSPETCWALSWPDALEIRREILAAIRSDKK